MMIYALSTPVFWVCLAIYYVLSVAGTWKMFEKAGEAGWKALIPVYNNYVVYQICWQTLYFWVWFGIAVFAAIFGLYTQDTTGLLYILALVLSIVQLLIQCTCSFRLSTAFGHGVWFGLGLYFFPFIFTLILGFGSSVYEPDRLNSFSS